MEEGASSSRKRKSAALEGEEASPPAPFAEAARSAHNRDQESPPGVGDGADRISSLPDALLGEIVSLLPTKEGARTQVLASRWRHVWRSAPVNLDFADFTVVWDVRAAIASRILSSHPGPGRRFRIKMFYLRSADRAVMVAALDAWLRSPTLQSLRELEFVDYEQPPPASIFRSSPTLSFLSIEGCPLHDATAQQGLHFPQLKQLGLVNISISERSLHSLIAGCPALESLLIHRSSGFRCLRINAISLRSIGASSNVSGMTTDETQLEELVIENAPCLQRLLRVDLLDGVHVSVISAPKLETLGCICPDYASYGFANRIIQGLRVDRLTTTVLHTVKTLAFGLWNADLDTTIELMRCFPCLEKLYVTCVSGGKNLWRQKYRKLIKSFDISLKTIVLGHYRGIMSQVNFATFFLLNAKVLESMTIRVQSKKYSRRFVAQQHMKLQWENRASRGARLHFTTDRCLRDVSGINHVRDLDLTDPFAYAGFVSSEDL